MSDVSLPPPANYSRVSVKGQGLSDDEVKLANAKVRSAINALRFLLDDQPMLDIRAAETDEELLEALKLYRDMNHLSLTGVTCDQVVEHVQSHTVLLMYRPDASQPAIAVSAATHPMRSPVQLLAQRAHAGMRK